jgi:DNA modification methylase
VRVERIGDCVIYNADCREILPTLTGIDAVVTDPPYGIGAGTGIGKVTKEGSDFRHCQQWDDATPSKETFDRLRLISKWQIIWGGNYFELPPSSSFLIWDKVQPEDFSLAMAEQAWSNIKKPAKIFRWKSMSINGGLPKAHPTQKPERLMAWCIRHLPDDALTILDPYMGSGTTGVACAKSGRSFVGIEIDPGYFDTACRRIEAAYREPDLFIERPTPPKQEALL